MKNTAVMENFNNYQYYHGFRPPYPYHFNGSSFIPGTVSQEPTPQGSTAQVEEKGKAKQRDSYFDSNGFSNSKCFCYSAVTIHCP